MDQPTPSADLQNLEASQQRHHDSVAVGNFHRKVGTRRRDTLPPSPQPPTWRMDGLARLVSRPRNTACVIMKTRRIKMRVVA